MFSDLEKIVKLICSCVTKFQKYKSVKAREKVILDLLQTYFLMKDSVDDGKQLIDEAGPDPIRKIQVNERNIGSLDIEPVGSHFVSAKLSSMMLCGNSWLAKIIWL